MSRTSPDHPAERPSGAPAAAAAVLLFQAVLVGADIAVAGTGVAANPGVSSRRMSSRRRSPWKVIAAVRAWWWAVRRFPTDDEVLDEKS